MPIDFWIVLWKALFIGGVGFFTALSLVVAIGGARDIVRLLRRLRGQRADDNGEA